MRINELQFLKTIISSNFLRPPSPFKLSFALTYKCNLRCRMCNIWRKEIEGSELSLEEISSFFKKANNFFWVGLTGGEPFLRRELLDIVDIIAKNCRSLCVLHFATNGQLTDRIADSVKRIHEKYGKIKIVFTVSIDGPEHLHDHIRGVAGSWDKAVATFRLLKKMEYVKAQIGFTFSTYNLDKFQETFYSLQKVYPAIKFDDININVFQKSNFYYGNQDMGEIDNARLLAAIKSIIEQDKEKLSVNNFLRRAYLRLYPEYIRSKKSPLKCKALSSSCFIDPYGNLFPCGIYNKKLINVRELRRNFNYTWKSSCAKKLSYECSNNICPGCWSPCDAFSSILGSLLQIIF